MANLKLTSLVKDKEVLKWVETTLKTPRKDLSISFPGEEIGRSNSSTKELPKGCFLIERKPDLDGSFVEVLDNQGNLVMQGVTPFRYLIYKSGTL